MQEIRDYRVILGSSSPRRSEILKLGEIEHSVSPNFVKEVLPEDIESKKAAEYLSKLKASAYSPESNELIITADTVVLSNNTILGKPKSEQDAIQMLQSYSDSSHDVVTGVTLKNQTSEISFSSTTEVIFHPISDEDIERYIKTESCFDKAGAYGIQDSFGSKHVKEIHGCFYNVMGLPLSAIISKLKEL